MIKKLIERYGNTVFFMAGHNTPFAYCYYMLGFNKLYDALISDHKLLYALLARQTEYLIERAKALARLGIHRIRILEFPCGAELISEKHYLRFVFPYEQRIIHTIHNEGLVAILEFLAQLPH